MSVHPFLDSAWRELAYRRRGVLRFALPILIPLSGLYGLLGRFRRNAYRLGMFRSQSFPVPILSVGNLTVGGVGKTPFTLYLAQRLHHLGFSPAILLRGYGRESNEPLLIRPGSFHTHGVVHLGDEPSLLAFSSNYPIAVDPDRARGVEKILDETDCDTILLDDGFQHLRLKRDLDLVLLDGQSPFGNGRCLPAGPLREPRSALRSAHALIVVGDSENTPVESVHRYGAPAFTGGLEWIGLYPLSNWMKQEGGTPLSIDSFQETPAVLASGIGSPGRLFDQAGSYGIPIHEHLCYPDHHWFTKEDLRVLAIKSRSHRILLTEKDAIRLFAVPEIPPELLEKTFVIHAAWRMKHPDRFDRWLAAQMTAIISPPDPVESNPSRE